MHISLDSAIGQQRRLNQVGETISSIAAPAAAYSLRSLTGGDPKVVRVRRESDNTERDFTASGVSSGAMVDFVNAQTIKPLDTRALNSGGSGDRDGDFQIASAAYSLRSLGDRQATVAATGDTVTAANGKYVVQVRRDFDDTIKSFTADEVTDGTLLSFCNNIQTVGTAVNGTGSVDNYTVTGASTTGFSADNSAGGVGSAGFPYVFKDEDVIVVRYTVTNFSSTSSLSPKLRGVNSISSTTSKTNTGTTITANGTYTDTLTATANGTHLMFADGDTGSYTISNFEIVSHICEGFVRTWYDQSVTDQGGGTATGNHATQTTAAEQPKIVSSGSLVSNGIDFASGSSATLDMPTDLISSTNSASAFLVAKSDTTGGSRIGLALSRNSPDFRFYLPFLSGSNFNFGYQDSATKISLGSADTNKHLFTAIAGSSNAEAFLDSTSKGTVSSADGKSALTSGGIGTVNDLNHWNGQIEEILVYANDQSDNRGAYEGNIADHYGITGVPTGANTVNGFVETWYDQSGNGNDFTQTTSGSQPKIVSSGSLLSDGIFFDGSDDKLTTSALYATNLSVFSAIKNDSSVRTSNFMRFIYIAGSSNSFQMTRGGSVDIGKYMSKNTAFQTGNDAFIHGTANGTQLLSAITTSSATTAFIDGSSQSNSGDLLGAGNNATTTLGARDDDLSSSFFEGSMRELIIYQSNETDNRVALEANINSHYSIF